MFLWPKQHCSFTSPIPVATKAGWSFANHVPWWSQPASSLQVPSPAAWSKPWKVSIVTPDRSFEQVLPKSVHTSVQVWPVAPRKYGSSSHLHTRFTVAKLASQSTPVVGMFLWPKQHCSFTSPIPVATKAGWSFANHVPWWSQPASSLQVPSPAAWSKPWKVSIVTPDRSFEQVLPKPVHTSVQVWPVAPRTYDSSDEETVE